MEDLAASTAAQATAVLRNGHRAVPKVLSGRVRGRLRRARRRNLQVRTVAIPRQTTIPAARNTLEHSRSFRKLVKWRTGCEGRISYLKPPLRLGPHPPGRPAGAAFWCSHGVFTHNLVKIAGLAR